MESTPPTHMLIWVYALRSHIHGEHILTVSTPQSYPSWHPTVPGQWKTSSTLKTSLLSRLRLSLDFKRVSSEHDISDTHHQYPRPCNRGPSSRLAADSFNITLFSHNLPIKSPNVTDVMLILTASAEIGCAPLGFKMYLNYYKYFFGGGGDSAI